MRHVVWTLAARRHLVGIRAYVGQFNPEAAADLAAQLIASGNSLALHPERGRLVRGNRRELVAAWPYLIGYRVESDTVTITRVRHGARRPEGV